MEDNRSTVYVHNNLFQALQVDYIFKKVPLNLWVISDPSKILTRESAEVTSTSAGFPGANWTKQVQVLDRTPAKIRLQPND